MSGSVNEVLASINSQQSRISSASKTSGASGVSSSSSQSSSSIREKILGTSSDIQENSVSSSSAEIKEEIEALEEEKQRNLKKMEMIEEEIEELAQEAEDNILEAAKKQEQAIAEHEDEAKEALDKEIKKYIEANKDGGNGMSKTQLQANIKSSMPNAPKIAQALAMLTEANEQIAQIDSLLGTLNLVINDVKLIEADIDIKTSQYDSALKAEEAAKCCDPIGFTIDGEQGQVRYDFIIDDGSFDSTDDFLGAQNQWAEMEALDVSKDGKVSAAELSSNNIKAVKTNPDGSQEIVDIAKELGDDFSIDLSSYSTGGSHSSVNTLSDADNDGIKDQTLLGTFDVNISGQTIEGYNTLDDVDYLSQQYGVSADAAEVQYSEDLAPHANFFEEFSATSANLKEDMINGYETIGVSEDFISLINKESQMEGSKQANIFMEQLEEELAAQEEAESEEISDEDTEDTVDENQESFSKQNITNMSMYSFEKYLEQIESAAKEGNSEAIAALNEISAEDIDEIASKSVMSASITNTEGEESANRAKEILEELKSAYPV